MYDDQEVRVLKTFSSIPWRMLLITAGLAVIDHGFRPLAGYLALDLGASAFHVGLLVATFAIGALVLAVPSGRIIDRYGPGKTLAISGALLPLPIFSALFVETINQLLFVAVASGCVHIFVVIAVQAAVVAGRNEVQFDAIFGWLSAGTSVGQMLGPLVALALPNLLPGSVATSGIATLACLACLVGFASVLSGLILSKDAQAPTSRGQRAPVVQILKTPGMLIAILLSGITLATLDLLIVFLPLWAQTRGITPTDVAVLLSIRGGMSLLSRMVMHVLVGWFTRKHLISVCLFLGATGMGLLPFIGLAPAYIVMAVFGFCLGLVQPLTMAWVVTAVSSSDRGTALGLRMLTNRSMQVLMPVVVGALSGPIGILGSASTRSLAVSAIALFFSGIVSVRSSWKSTGNADDQIEK